MSENTPTNETPQSENKIEKRINQLYGEKKEAEETALNYKNENEQLRTQMLELQEQMKEFKKPSEPTMDPPTGETNNVSGLNEAKIQEIVEQSVGKVLSKNQAIAQEQEVLRSAQVKSWKSAANTYPILSDQNSDLYKTAQNIWERDASLRSDPNGPNKAVLMANGILGSNAVQGPEVNAAAQQQTINSNISAGNVDAKLVELDKQIKEAKDALYQPVGGNVGNAWMKYKDLQAQRGELLKQKKG